MCAQCLIQHKITDLSECYSIEQIINSQKKELILNFPPLGDELIYERVQEALSKQDSSLSDQLQSNQLDDLQQAIIQKLGDLKKQVLARNIQILTFKDTLLDLIYEISGKEILSSLLTNANLSQQELKDRIEQFTQQKESQKQENTLTIYKCLNEHKENVQNRFPCIDSLKANILSLIDDHINKQVKPQQKLQNKNINLKSSQSLLEQAKNLQQPQQQIPPLQTKPQENTLNIELQNFISSIQYQMKEIEKNYFQIQEDFQNQQIQIKQQPSKSGLIYFKVNLTKSSKHQILFQVKCPPQNSIMVGLLEQSLAPHYFVSLTHTGKNFGKASEYGEDFCNKIIKGENIQTAQNTCQMIEMRIDVSNKVIQFLDYPNYNNINQLNDSYQLNSESTYHLALEFNSSTESEGSQINIKYINNDAQFKIQ